MTTFNTFLKKMTFVLSVWTMTASGSSLLYNRKPNKTEAETDADSLQKDCFSCTMNNYVFCGMWYKPPLKTYCWPKFDDESAVCRETKTTKRPAIARKPSDCNDREINP